MVAKSFQNLKICGEPFNVKGKLYVMVEKTDGSTRRVRWYSEREYARMYSQEEPTKIFKTAKEIFGFDKGFIWIFCGDTYAHKDYLRDLPQTRYHALWGWYVISTETLPEDIPEGILAEPLSWDKVGNTDGSLKNEAEITAVIDAMRYEEDPSEFQGEVGDKIEVFATVERNITLEGAYGLSHMHIMRDYDGNCYVWTTTAKDWEEGTEHHFTGKIKAQRIYRNVRQTVLTRCVERRN